MLISFYKKHLNVLLLFYVMLLSIKVSGSGTGPQLFFFALFFPTFFCLNCC